MNPSISLVLNSTPVCGSNRPIPVPAPDMLVAGAATTTSNSAASSLASRSSPGESIPSSLVMIYPWQIGHRSCLRYGLYLDAFRQGLDEVLGGASQAVPGDIGGSGGTSQLEDAPQHPSRGSPRRPGPPSSSLPPLWCRQARDRVSAPGRHSPSSMARAGRSALESTTPSAPCSTRRSIAERAASSSSPSRRPSSTRFSSLTLRMWIGPPSRKADRSGPCMSATTVTPAAARSCPSRR